MNKKWLYLLFIIVIFSCRSNKDYVYIRVKPAEILGKWTSVSENMEIDFIDEKSCELKNILYVGVDGKMHRISGDSIYSIHENGPHKGVFIVFSKLNEYLFLRKKNNSELILELQLSADPIYTIDFKRE